MKHGTWEVCREVFGFLFNDVLQCCLPNAVLLTKQPFNSIAEVALLSMQKPMNSNPRMVCTHVLFLK